MRYGLCRCNHDRTAHSGKPPRWPTGCNTNTCTCLEYAHDESAREQYALAMAATDGRGPEAAHEYYRYADEVLRTNAEPKRVETGGAGPSSHRQLAECSIDRVADALNRTPDEDGGPQEPTERSETEQLHDRLYTAERALSRIREALGTETLVTAAGVALNRVRALHRAENGWCWECTAETAIAWPCPTIRAIEGDTTTEETSP